MQESLEQQVAQVSSLLEQILLPSPLVLQASRLQVRMDHTLLIHSVDVTSASRHLTLWCFLHRAERLGRRSRTHLLPL